MKFLYKWVFEQTSFSTIVPTTFMVQTKIFLKPEAPLHTTKVVRSLSPPQDFCGYKVVVWLSIGKLVDETVRIQYTVC